MNPSTCPRIFEVEALRDGRLTGDECKSFERHLARCKACADEARALEALGRALLQSSPPMPDQLHVRRERVRLLAAFDQTLVASRKEPALRRPLLSLGLTLAALLCATLLLLWRAPGTPEAPATAPANVVVQAQRDARWSRQVRGERELIVLERGKLRIRVNPKASERSLLVMLPDGQLEDIGTTFSVSVAGGRTTNVEVEEGRVRLSLRGRAPVSIGAGETWQRPETQAPATPHASRGAPTPPPSAVSVGPSPPPPATATRAASRPPSLAAESDASADFRSAMAALNAGQHQQAARELARFSVRHARDARAQDAAYLRVIALERAGDKAAMRAAALDYLRRYPDGFRRAEVEMLVK